jgi:hypothetical protein
VNVNMIFYRRTDVASVKVGQTFRLSKVG